MIHTKFIYKILNTFYNANHKNWIVKLNSYRKVENTPYSEYRSKKLFFFK